MQVKFNAVTSPIVRNENGELMGAEEYIIYCARLSSKDRVNSKTAPRLLKYLIDHKHWSPFEMVSAGFEIQTSRAIAQQLLRHRSFSFQEFSQRYAEVSSVEIPELRQQAESNRQSSTSVVEDPNLEGMALEALQFSENVYQHLVENGVAKECARMVLPLATSTTLVMHGTLRSWIHFFDQRCDSHAQKEIQHIAFEIREQLATAFPWVAEVLWFTVEDARS